MHALIIDSCRRNHPHHRQLPPEPPASSIATAGTTRYRPEALADHEPARRLDRTQFVELLTFGCDAGSNFSRLASAAALEGAMKRAAAVEAEF